METLYLKFIELGAVGVVGIVIVLFINRRDERASENFRQMLQIAMANTEALTKMTASVEGLAEIVAHNAETVSRASGAVTTMLELMKDRLNREG